MSQNREKDNMKEVKTEESKLSQDVATIRKSMKQTYDSQVNHTLEWRMKALETMQKMLKNNETEILTALQEDLGRSFLASFAVEVMFLQNEVQYFIKNLKKWMKPQAVATPISFFPMRSEIVSVPLSSPGVLVIGPCNYPLLLTLRPAIGALAGGNPAVLKPSEFTTSTAKIMEKLIHSHFDKNVLQVIQGEADVVQQLLKEPWGKVVFTGSERVGKIVAKSCAETLTPCLLELGGKNPAYVCSNISDKDLRVMAKRLVWGHTLNAGQTCISPDTIICQEEILNKFVDFMIIACNEMFGDDAKTADFAKIVSSNHTKRLVDMIKEVQTANKACVVYGGVDKCDVSNRFVEPTIIVNPPKDSRIMKEEIFGPIMPVVAVANEKEAIEFMENMRGTPLALYIFTNSKEQFHRIRSTCPSGSILQNDVLLQFAVQELPLGGLGTSGQGAYVGKFSFDSFTHKLSSSVNPCSSIGDLFFGIRFPPYDGVRAKLLRFFMDVGPDIPPMLTSSAFWVTSISFIAIIGTYWQPVCLNLANILDSISDKLKNLA